MLRLEIEELPEATVVRCSGRIVKGDGADTLLRAAKSAKEPRIQIDLNGVEAIDAAGLGALAELERWARDANRKIQWMNPSKRVRAVLKLTRLGSVLGVYPDAPVRPQAA
jgi:anti-anti-sigma factor